MNETEESDEEFRKRIFNLIRATIVHCFIEDHDGRPPRIAHIPDSVIQDVIIKASETGPPEDEEDLIARTKRIYRLTANQAAMYKGLN